MRDAIGGYRLLRSIAVGGVGEVFAAEGPAGPCALKRLHPELSRHREARAQFELEGELARRFDHPNLARGLDAGQDGGHWFIAFELVAGPTLAQAQPVSPDRAVAIALDLCSGLGRLHADGWVHADVVPSNVLLHPDGRAVLTDFGVAGRIGERQGSVRGTFGYMPPEQARGEPLDARTDLFALGAVLWEMLTGRRLFQRAAPHLSLAAAVEEAAPPTGVSEDLDRLLARALAKSPHERPESCAELSEQLAAITRSPR